MMMADIVFVFSYASLLSFWGIVIPDLLRRHDETLWRCDLREDIRNAGCYGEDSRGIILADAPGMRVGR